MFKNWSTYLQYGNRFCGLEHTTKNEKAIINATVLKQSKKELDIETTFQVDSTKDVVVKLSKNQHTVLVINNEKVLSKTIESEQNDSLKLVYKAFPNINLEDFYFEVLSENKNHFISLCRKDYIESLIDTYAKNKVFIVAISLGNNLVSTIKPFVNFKQIITSNARISFEENHIKEIKKTEVVNESYNINGLSILNEQVLSFAGALQSVLKNSSTKTNFETKRESLLNEFNQIRFFNQFLKFGGLFVLGILLVNFFMFSHYFNKVNDLKQVSDINKSTKVQIVKLNETVSKKQKMVDDLLKSNGSKSSFYANAIMQSLSKTVSLTEFNYQPLEKRIKTDKEIDLMKNRIIISGTSNDSEAFSNWINQLEQMLWISKVDIVDYGSVTNITSDFQIKIQLSNDD